MATNTTFAIEGAITLDGLRVFKQEADQHYADTSTATTSADGLMSSTDKTRLNGIASVNGIVKENGSGTASAASASDVVTLLGSTAVNRATSDASGNDIANTYATKTALNGKADASHMHSEYQTQHTTATCSLTAAGWTNNTQTASAAGVTATNTVIVAPAPASAAAWAAAGVICTAQAAGSLTFTCTTAPTDALTANVLVLGGGLMLYSIDNGDPLVMSIDKASAQAGETVTVTNLTSSALSWELNGVSQTDIAASGTATFTMPAENVVVAEYVVPARHVYFDYDSLYLENGDTGSHRYADGDEVEVGSTVMVSTLPGVGNSKTQYAIKVNGVIVGYVKGNGGGDIGFTMPDEDAYVTYE